MSLEEYELEQLRKEVEHELELEELPRQEVSIKFVEFTAREVTWWNEEFMGLYRIHAIKQGAATSDLVSQLDAKAIVGLQENGQIIDGTRMVRADVFHNGILAWTRVANRIEDKSKKDEEYWSQFPHLREEYAQRAKRLRNNIFRVTNFILPPQRD